MKMRKKLAIKKIWLKPYFLTVHKEDLANHIRSAACSGMCWGVDTR